MVQVISREVELDLTELMRLTLLGRGQVSLVEIDIPADTPDQRVVDLVLPPPSILVSVVCGEEVMVPQAGTVISAVGNTIQPLFTDAGLPVVRNRIKVTPEMRVEGYDNVWALGDCAAVPNALDGSTSPTLGQFAIR